MTLRNSINKLNTKHKKKGKKHKGIGKIGGKFNKFGKGLVKRTDSIGKFTGKLVKQQSSAFGGLLGGLSNPLVLVGGLVLAGIVIVNMNQ